MKRDVFRDNVVVLTGASSGIGREMAFQLAEQGARLVLAARGAERLEAVARECRQRGTQALPVPTDVAHEAQCRRLVETTVAEFGRLDTLINNAGVGFVAAFEDLPDLDLFERVLRVNFLGSVYCTYHALPHLKRAQGRIVAVSSLSGKFGVPRTAAYCASKHAMAGLFDALRNELLGSGVSVTVVYPNLVRTPFFERALGPAGQARGRMPPALERARMMSAARCARITLQAAARRRRERVLSLSGKAGLWARLLAPALLDRVIRHVARAFR